ncbi:MAG: transposase family protein [Clostridia bacterium]
MKIQGVNVKNILESENSFTFHIETTSKTHICPSCHHETSKIHDYRNQIIQHGSFNNTIIFLDLKKRRYECPHCSKRFYEDYSFIQKFFRKSNNLFDKIISDSKMQ